MEGFTKESGTGQWGSLDSCRKVSRASRCMRDSTGPALDVSPAVFTPRVLASERATSGPATTDQARGNQCRGWR